MSKDDSPQREIVRVPCMNNGWIIEDDTIAIFNGRQHVGVALTFVANGISTFTKFYESNTIMC